MIGYLRRQWPWWFVNCLLLVFSGFMVGWCTVTGNAFGAGMNGVSGGFALSNLFGEFMTRRFRQRANRDFPLDREKAAEEAVYRGIKNGIARLERDGVLQPGDLDINQLLPPSTRH